MTLLLPVLLLVFMYMLLIRPQQQRVKRQRALVTSLAVGDRIVTIGGVVGTIVALRDETADIEVAEGVVITFLRPAINRKYDATDDNDEQVAVDDGHDAPDGTEGSA